MPGIRKLFIILILCLAIPLQSVAYALPKDLQTELDLAVAESHIPSLAVLIVDADSVIYSKTYGMATPDTPFLLGSLSKSFTALCILQLQAQGLLTLEDDVSKYLSDVPPGLTVRQLLNQTGGIDTYQLPEETKPSKPAGAHIYSNTNYALLGRIVESVSGLSYDHYLRDNVLDPLGMAHTSSTKEGAIANGLIRGYTNWFGIPVPSDPRFPGPKSWIQPSAGYISSSANDMARYLQMYLRNGDGILNPELIKDMFTQSIPVEANIPYTYGFGWTTIHEPLSSPVYRHSGLVETGMSCMYLLPEQRLGVIILANMNDYLVGTDLMDRLGWNLILALLGDKPGSIDPGEYMLRHTLFDLVYIALIVIAVLPLFRIKRLSRLPDSSKATKKAITFSVAYCFGIPGFLLIGFPAIMHTPLWVITDFVPDLFFVFCAASGILVLAGALRLHVILRKSA